MGLRTERPIDGFDRLNCNATILQRIFLYYPEYTFIPICEMPILLERGRSSITAHSQYSKKRTHRPISIKSINRLEEGHPDGSYVNYKRCTKRNYKTRYSKNGCGYWRRSRN